MTDLAGCRIYEVDRPAKRADMVTLVWDRCDMYVTDSNAMSVDSGKRFRNVTTANMLTPSSYKLFVSSIHKTILYMYTMSWSKTTTTTNKIHVLVRCYSSFLQFPFLKFLFLFNRLLPQWKLPGQISTTKILGPKLVKSASSVRKLQLGELPGWDGSTIGDGVDVESHAWRDLGSHPKKVASKLWELPKGFKKKTMWSGDMFFFDLARNCWWFRNPARKPVDIVNMFIDS